MPIPIVKLDEIKPDQLEIMIAGGAAPMVAASEIKRLLDEIAALKAELESQIISTLKAEKPDATLISEFEVIYRMEADGQIIMSIDGQAHIPINPIEVLYSRDAEITALNEEIERLGARLDQFAETAQLQGAELALLRQQLADANTQHNQTLKTLHDITNEYQALWSVLVAYMNAPGHSSEAEYTALVRQTWQSRFWSEQSS